MIMKWSSLVVVVILAALLPNHHAQQVGDTICAEGFIMDDFCLYRNNGRLLDTRDITLENPGAHTLHCLVDVGLCNAGPFYILGDPETPGDLHTVDYILDDAGHLTLLEMARQDGRKGGGCTTCLAEMGGLRRGYRAEVIGIVESVDPPPTRLRLVSAQTSNELTEVCAGFENGRSTNVPTVVPSAVVVSPLRVPSMLPTKGPSLRPVVVVTTESPTRKTPITSSPSMLPPTREPPVLQPPPMTPTPRVIPVVIFPPPVIRPFPSPPSIHTVPFNSTEEEEAPPTATPSVAPISVAPISVAPTASPVVPPTNTPSTSAPTSFPNSSSAILPTTGPTPVMMAPLMETPDDEPMMESSSSTTMNSTNTTAPSTTMPTTSNDTTTTTTTTMMPSPSPIAENTARSVSSASTNSRTLPGYLMVVAMGMLSFKF